MFPPRVCACADDEPQWKDVFVCQMPNTWTRNQFLSLCSTTLVLQFGSLAEHFVTKIWFDHAPGGGFGFASFSTHAAACCVATNVNGLHYEGWMLYASRHFNARREAANAVDAATATLLKSETVNTDMLKSVVLTQYQLIKSLVVGQEQMSRRLVALERQLSEQRQ